MIAGDYHATLQSCNASAVYDDRYACENLYDKRAVIDMNEWAVSGSGVGHWVTMQFNKVGDRGRII